MIAYALDRIVVGRYTIPAFRDEAKKILDLNIEVKDGEEEKIFHYLMEMFPELGTKAKVMKIKSSEFTPLLIVFCTSDVIGFKIPLPVKFEGNVNVAGKTFREVYDMFQQT